MCNLKILEDENALPLTSLDYINEEISVSKFLKEYDIENIGLIVEENAHRQLITFADPAEILQNAMDIFGENISVSSIPELPENLFPDDTTWAKLLTHESMIKITAYTTWTAAVEFVFNNRPFTVVLSPDNVRTIVEEKIDRFYSTQKKLLEVLTNGDNKE